MGASPFPPPLSLWLWCLFARGWVRGSYVSTGGFPCRVFCPHCTTAVWSARVNGLWYNIWCGARCYGLVVGSSSFCCVYFFYVAVLSLLFCRRRRKHGETRLLWKPRNTESCLRPATIMGLYSRAWNASEISDVRPTTGTTTVLLSVTPCAGSSVRQCLFRRRRLWLALSLSLFRALWRNFQRPDVPH